MPKDSHTNCAIQLYGGVLADKLAAKAFSSAVGGLDSQPGGWWSYCSTSIKKKIKFIRHITMLKMDFSSTTGFGDGHKRATQTGPWIPSREVVELSACRVGRKSPNHCTQLGWATPCAWGVSLGGHVDTSQSTVKTYIDFQMEERRVSQQLQDGP